MKQNDKCFKTLQIMLMFVLEMFLHNLFNMNINYEYEYYLFIYEL